MGGQCYCGHSYFILFYSILFHVSCVTLIHTWFSTFYGYHTMVSPCTAVQYYEILYTEYDTVWEWFVGDCYETEEARCCVWLGWIVMQNLLAEDGLLYRSHLLFHIINLVLAWMPICIDLVDSTLDYCAWLKSNMQHKNEKNNKGGYGKAVFMF